MNCPTLGLKSIIGDSKHVKDLQKQILKINFTYIKNIIIHGETGTGKEVVAKAIAEYHLPQKPFLPVHCGALTDSLYAVSYTHLTLPTKRIV